MAKKKHTSLNRKKKFEVLASTPEALQNVKGFVDDKNPSRKMMLDRYGRAVIRDSGVVDEIRSRYGAKKYGGDGSVTIVPVDDERKKPSVFTVPELPWKKKDEA